MSLPITLLSISAWRALLMLVFVLLGVALAFAADADGNLVVNPGFEQPAVENTYLGWTFVTNGQDGPRGEIQAQDYHGGLHAASINLPQTPKVYACWGQHIRVADDAALPNSLSLWYRAADQPCIISITYTTLKDGKADKQTAVGFNLPVARDWTHYVDNLTPPAGTRDILLELRAYQKGLYLFDDVALKRNDAIAAGLPLRVLFVGITRDQLPALWQDPLVLGNLIPAFESWDNLSPALLKQCRAVVLVNLPRRQLVTPLDDALADLLLDYVKAGGGVLLTQDYDQMQSAMTLPMYLAKRFGTRILLEKVITPKELTKQIGPWNPDIFTFTTKVNGPWTNGVNGIWFPSIAELGCQTGVLPFEPSAPWQVALSGGTGTKSEIYLTGLDDIDKEARAQGFADDVPLAGYRDFGKGRAGYIGCYAPIIFTRNMSSADDRKTYDAYMRTGIDGKAGDLLRFYVNAFHWLGANADALANTELKQRPLPPSPFTTAWTLHRGIIGPRTRYSSGESTPDEYVAKAKAAGLDFVVFLEDFATLKPGAFDQLKTDCRRLTTGGFVAVPGITFQNDQGNHEFVFSDTLRLPSKTYLDPTGKRVKTFYPDAQTGGMTDLKWWYTLLGFDNVSGWYDFKENPYPFYDTRDVCAIAIVTQQGGNTLERVLDAHAYQARSGQFTWPLALNLMTNARELEHVTDGTAYVNVVGADGTAQLYNMLTTGIGRSAHLYPGSPGFGTIYLTNGPAITLTMPRGDTDAVGNPYNPNLQEWPLKLTVTSPTGLREVKLCDGDTVLRRYLPNGAKTFSIETSLPKERQRAVWVWAIDMKGKEAIGRDINCNSWLLRENQCGDRNNQLLDSRQLRPDGTPFFVGYGGETTMPDKGPWNGRIRPVGCFVFDAKLGVGSMAYDGSPENHPAASMAPYLVYDGVMPPSMGWSSALVAGREGSPHVKPTRVVASSDVLIAERVLDGVFPVDAKPVIHVWHTLYPVKPSAYLKTSGRVTLYRIKPDGISAYLWSQDFTILQDIPLKMDVPIAVGVGTFGASTAKECLLVNNGTVTEQQPVNPHPVKTYAFNAGDYLGLLKSPFGSFVAYSLTDGLVLSGDGVNFRAGVKPTSALLKAGSTISVKILLVGMHRQVADPAALAAKIRTDYGLTGKPSYTVTVTQGRITDQHYVLSAAANADGAFQGSTRGLAALDGNLGSAVTGLHDNWTAAFQVRDGDRLKTRLMPVEQGTGYALWQAEDEGRLVTIGHPIIADTPQITLSLTRSADWKSWQLEAHNPTDKPITAVVRANPAFTGFHFTETLTLAPGSSLFRNLGPVVEQ